MTDKKKTENQPPKKEEEGFGQCQNPIESHWLEEIRKAESEEEKEISALLESGKSASEGELDDEDECG